MPRQKNNWWEGLGVPDNSRHHGGPGLLLSGSSGKDILVLYERYSPGQLAQYYGPFTNPQVVLAFIVDYQMGNNLDIYKTAIPFLGTGFSAIGHKGVNEMREEAKRIAKAVGLDRPATEPGAGHSPSQ